MSVTRRQALARIAALGAATCTLSPRVFLATNQSVPTPGSVRTGVDVLMSERTDLLRGRSIGLVTNATGRDTAGQSTIDLLNAAPDWHLLALFSPEHGIRGDADAGQNVDSSVDARTGLPVYSLYGATTRPTDAMLNGLDTLVYDIQDVGARPYTYTTTLLEVLRAAASRGLTVVVLDRPDPIGGDQVEGNVLNPEFASFVGPAPIAMRYGMSIGELGQFFNAELGVGADLHVVPMAGWHRADWFDQTGLSWVNPSPNLRSISAAALYPGLVLVEGSNLSEGRGTERPFEWVGAPWIDAFAWADLLGRLSLPGAQFSAETRTPDSAKFAGQVCQGVAIEIVDRAQLKPMQLGVALLSTARQIAPARLQFADDTFDRLAGTDQVRLALQAGQLAADIAATWQPALDQFRELRQRYLLYS